jgi:hypothetical protein
MDCPNRCSIQSWKLDEVAAITPEVFDVWVNMDPLLPFTSTS